MKQLLISVYDVKAGAYNAPVSMISKAAAIRSFSDAVNDPKSDFAKHPEDYSINVVGEWDPVSGVLKPLSVPEPLITARECLAAVNQAA